MIKTIELPDELIAGTAEESAYRYGGPGVSKTTLEGIDEIQYLYVSPWTSIKNHGHDGHGEYSYDDFGKFFYYLGFSVHHGSLVVNK